ncbi:MAG: hypothetical protein AAB581_04055 [Patescibacteria group bacterium]
MNRTTLIFVLIAIVCVTGIATAAYFFGALPIPSQTSAPAKNQPDVKTVIREELTIPLTERVAEADTRTIASGTVAMPLGSEGDTYIVPGAELTVKESVARIVPDARGWSDDARLVSVKSQGAVDVNGKSSQWQIIFHSAEINTGYEFIVRGTAIISQKEIESSTQGTDVPELLRDSSDAVAAIRALPQFADATMSGISLFYNADAQKWSYGIATSRGATSVPAQ